MYFFATIISFVVQYGFESLLVSIIFAFGSDGFVNWCEILKQRSLRIQHTDPSCRFVNSLVYYGLNLNVKNLGGNFYLNFFILCVVEIPGALLCWFCLGR